MEYNGFMLFQDEVSGLWYFEHNGRKIYGSKDDLTYQIDVYVEHN